MGSIEEETPLIEEGLISQGPKLYAEDGSVDLHGNPPLKEKTGNWKACPFILGNDCCERLAYYGIAGNLITYLTTKLHQGNVSADRGFSYNLKPGEIIPLKKLYERRHNSRFYHFVNGNII